MNFEITTSARERIIDLCIDENRPALVGIRTYVQGGGCSGFQYGFTFEDIVNEDDFIIDLDNSPYKILVDSMSAMYLEGAVLDYKTELMGSQFVFENPNATGTCGCGSSFRI